MSKMNKLNNKRSPLKPSKDIDLKSKKTSLPQNLIPSSPQANPNESKMKEMEDIIKEMSKKLEEKDKIIT